MSTILDALKKSEQERKLNDLPTLSDMPAPKEQSQWPQIIIIALLALLLLALIVLLSRSWTADSANGPAAKNIVLTNDTVANEEPSEANAQASISVNVVSFAADPDQRFAMINGKMARENEFVRAGLKVEEIKPNSVILIERGRRIELSP